MSPNRQQLRDRFKDLSVWKQGGERAPYKPLLLLYALGRYARGAERLLQYSAIDRDLLALFREFGPPRTSYNPVYPFWYLRSDGVWEVPGSEPARVREGKSGEPTKTWLRENQIGGGLLPDLYEAFRSDPGLLQDVATDLLDAHFPESLHAEILEAVGLGVLPVTTPARRDPAFRHKVLRAYQRRCAVCSFDARLGDAVVGIEAAHIQWHQAGGPPRVSNGIALCSLHHKLFDRGVFTLTDERRVLVSEELSGSEATELWVSRFHGEPLRSPNSPSSRPDPVFVAWHRREVFRGPAREL